MIRIRVVALAIAACDICLGDRKRTNDGLGSTEGLMDGWLKALLAVASIAVVMVVGHYFWEEWSASRERTAARMEVHTAHEQLRRLARAEDGDRERVHYFCQAVQSAHRSDPTSLTSDVLRNCRRFGYLGAGASY